MNNKEFQVFMKMVDEAYPKQKSINQIQKGFYWMSLNSHKFDDCVVALSKHVAQSEWKPQVNDIVSKLSCNEENIRDMFRAFLNRKDVKDDIACSIYQRMGGLSLNQHLSEKDTPNKEQRFVEMYLDEISKNNYDSLPSNLKKRLIGGK
jgi:hypothetical protein